MAINLIELQILLIQAATTAATEKEIRKSLVRVESLVNNVTKELTSIYELLNGTAHVGKPRQTHAPKEATESNPKAPY